MKNSNNKIIAAIALAMLLFVSVMHVSAQMVELGVRYMPTFSDFEMKSWSGGDVRGEATLGHGFGVLLGINFNDHVGIQGEVIYNSISQRYKEFGGERKVNLRYVNIPLLISLNSGKTKVANFNFVVGPQIGISAGSSIENTNGDFTIFNEPVLEVKKGDLGFAYGAGVDFGLNSTRTFRLGIGFRGVYGLFDISDDSNSLETDSYYVLEKSHVKTYSAYVGLSILLGQMVE